MNTLGIFKQHLSDEVFAVIQKGSIPEVMPTLTPMEYPEGYEAISVTDDDGYQQLMQRLAESVQKSVVPAQQPAAEQRQPIPAELKQLIENGRLSPDQLGDLILGYNFIVQEMHKLPPKENELERGPAEGLIWTDYDKLCDRLAVYSSIFDTTLVPHLVDPLLLVLQYNKPIPQPMEYPNTYSPPNLLDLNEFAAAMARYPRFPWEPAESSATPPSTQNVKVVEQAPALPKPLSEKGQRELATDFHERIVVELESMPGVGTLGKKDKSAIAVFIGTEGKGHSLTLTVPDAMKRDPSKQALCSAFREVVRKLQSHVYALGGLNPNQQDFLITEQRDWAPEPLWKPGAPAQAHTPSGDICPVKFRAKTAESLLNGLNEALSEGNRIAPETYSAHGMRAGDVVGGPGRP